MLDFQKRKRKYFEIKLHDGTELKIPTPTRAIYDDLMEMYQDPEAAVRRMPDLLVAVLKSNRDKTPITEAQLDEFDIEDLYDFFTGYANFVSATLDSPNSKSPTAQ